MLYESGESYRQGVQTDRFFIAPTIGWALSGQTTLRWEAEYLHDKSPISAHWLGARKCHAPAL